MPIKHIPYRSMWRLLEMHLIARYEREKTIQESETGSQQNIRIRVNEIVQLVREVAPDNHALHQRYWLYFRDDFLTLCPEDYWFRWTHEEMFKIERIVTGDNTWREVETTAKAKL